MATGPQQPNILFLLSDEHSFRFLGHVPYEDGGEDVATPALDLLAGRSAAFAHAYCASPLCVPSRMCLLTGLEAQRAGGWNNASILDPAVDTLPKMLERAGYATCLVGKMHFGGKLQFHGFRHRPYGDLMGNASHQFEDTIATRSGDGAAYTGAQAGGNSDDGNDVGDDLAARTRDAGTTKIPESLIVDQVIADETTAFLREQHAREPGRPWFVCASFSRPHFPLTAPRRHLDRYPPDAISAPRVPAHGASFDHPVSAAIRDGFEVGRIDHQETMRGRSSYFACVSYLDEIIGDLLLRLEASGLLENTVIVYSSDHGEMAGEHGTWWKSGWYEACTRVPLLVSLPEHRNGALAARRIETPVSLLDLMPTFAALAGGSPAGAVSGVDLSPSIRGGGLSPDRPIVCDHLNVRWGEGSEFRMVRWRNYKLVAFRKFGPLFFDLDRDPGEQHDIFGSATGDALAARNRLQEFVVDSMDFDSLPDRRAASQARLKREFGLERARALPNQYMLSTGRVIEGDLAMYRQGVITDDPSTFFADWPGEREAAK
jgi:choline-sulfatase